MAKTVVGLFKSMVEAQNVKHDLVNEGYSSESVQVVANEGSTGGSTGSYSGTTGANSEDTGVMASVKKFFSSFTETDEDDRNYYTAGVNKGGAIVAVTVPDERAAAVQSILEQHGGSDVDKRSAGAGTAATSRKQAVTAKPAGEVAIPIVEEELLVGKRQVNRGGVRVYSHVVETPVQENIQLREEHVRVQRNTVDRPASEADFQGFKEGTVELTETAEEAVVSKQARVVEEVVVGKDVSERTQNVTDRVRRTEVQVEEMTPDNVKRTGAGK